MPNSEQTPCGKGAGPIPDAKVLNRRDFLRIAGLSGAAIALGGGLGGLVAACGETDETTTTAAASTTTTAAASTTTIGATDYHGRPRLPVPG